VRLRGGHAKEVVDRPAGAAGDQLQNFWRWTSTAVLNEVNEGPRDLVAGELGQAESSSDSSLMHGIGSMSTPDPRAPRFTPMMRRSVNRALSWRARIAYANKELSAPIPFTPNTTCIGRALGHRQQTV